MDRLELRTKFAGRIEKFRLEEFDLEVYLRRLTAFERAKYFQQYEKIQTARSSGEKAEVLQDFAKEVQCFVVGCCLVDETGKRIYEGEEADKLGDEIPCTALDDIYKQILFISRLNAGEVSEKEKNLLPTPNASSSSGLQPGSDGGTSTPSSGN